MRVRGRRTIDSLPAGAWGICGVAQVRESGEKQVVVSLPCADEAVVVCEQSVEQTSCLLSCYPLNLLLFVKFLGGGLMAIERLLEGPSLDI